MHSHHLRNPLFRTFTGEENKVIEEEKQKEQKQELIQEQFGKYQTIACDDLPTSNIREDKKTIPMYN